jgi:nitrogen fixation NifU-like protein
MWVNLLLACGVLIIVVSLWFGISYWLSPNVKDPDGKARVTGTCGDTMELHLKLQKNRIRETSHYTTGCTYSYNCIAAVAQLVKGQTPEEALNLDANTVQKSIGGLPEDHMHCATLAVDALHEAVGDCMRKMVGKKSPPSLRS